MNIDPQMAKQMLEAQLQPWQAAIAEPAKAQDAVLHHLLQDYAKTDYGARHGAANIGSLTDYRRAFPVATYEDYRPIIQQVMAGDINRLLWEDPVGWAITRGTTKGESKFIPVSAIERNPASDQNESQKY